MSKVCLMTSIRILKMLETGNVVVQCIAMDLATTSLTGDRAVSKDMGEKEVSNK